MGHCVGRLSFPLYLNSSAKLFLYFFLISIYFYHFSQKNIFYQSLVLWKRWIDRTSMFCWHWKIDFPNFYQTYPHESKKYHLLTLIDLGERKRILWKEFFLRVFHLLTFLGVYSIEGITRTLWGPFVPLMRLRY